MKSSNSAGVTDYFASVKRPYQKNTVRCKQIVVTTSLSSLDELCEDGLY